MSENQAQEAAKEQEKEANPEAQAAAASAPQEEAKEEKPKKQDPPAPSLKSSNLSKRNQRSLARKKRALKIKTDPEFAKKYFEARSKRSAEKKVSYRKRHSKA